MSLFFYRNKKKTVIQNLGRLLLRNHQKTSVFFHVNRTKKKSYLREKHEQQSGWHHPTSETDESLWDFLFCCVCVYEPKASSQQGT